MKRKKYFTLFVVVLFICIALIIIAYVKESSSDTKDSNVPEVSNEDLEDTSEPDAPTTEEQSPTEDETEFKTRDDLVVREESEGWTEVSLEEVSVDVAWLTHDELYVPGQYEMLWQVINCVTDLYNGTVTDSYTFDTNTDASATETPFITRYTLHGDTDLCIEVDSVEQKYRVVE